MIRIFTTGSAKALEEAARLFKEYADSLEISLDFQNFDEELAALPGCYAPPEGCILLATWQGQIAGCVALRKLEDGVCEMKRLYTRPAFRGKKIGVALAEAVIEEARRLGYQRMRLDTLKSMVQARTLYKSLGFYEIAAYCYNPFEDAVFMELKLSSGQTVS